MTDVFNDPHASEKDRAYIDGKLDWHRQDKANPYLVSGEALSELWWYWDFGRREGIFLNQVAQERVATFYVESDARPASRFRSMFGGGV